MLQNVWDRVCEDRVINCVKYVPENPLAGSLLHRLQAVLRNEDVLLHGLQAVLGNQDA